MRKDAVDKLVQINNGAWDEIKQLVNAGKLIESKYEEKISGEEKNIVVEWLGIRKVTDYFSLKEVIKS